jgi:hypothetical protein
MCMRMVGTTYLYAQQLSQSLRIEHHLALPPLLPPSPPSSSPPTHIFTLLGWR